MNTNEIKHIRDLVLADMINGNDKNINGDILRKLDEKLTIPDVGKSLPDFESCYKTDFLKKYKDVCSEKLLVKIWEFGNKRWSDGYEQGKHNPDFE